MTCSGAGSGTAPGRGFLPSSGPRGTRRALSPGTSTSTPLSARPISTPQGRRGGGRPEGTARRDLRRAGRPRPRTFPGWADSKRPLAVEQGGRGPAGRASARTGCGPTRRSGSGGPGPQPHRARIPRRSTAEVRQGGLQAAARGRARDQPAQAPPNRRQPVRQTRRPLRSDSAGRSHQGVALTSTFTTDPRRCAPLPPGPGAPSSPRRRGHRRRGRARPGTPPRSRRPPSARSRRRRRPR